MPQSLAKVVLHIVFSTKNRASYLENNSIRGQLHSYLAGVLKSLDCQAIIVGGVSDHIHSLNLLSRTRTISSVLEEIKTSTSKWIKTNGAQHQDFHWQNGYGVFSVSESRIPEVRKYIENQEEHHRT